MGKTKRRSLYLSAFGTVMVPLLAASLAHACTSLARVELSPPAGVPGTEVSGTAKDFVHSTAGAPAQPVIVRFNSRTGPVLASVPTDATGTAQFSFRIPEVDPGYYTIIAMQDDASGRPVSGSPARASLQVTGPALSSSAPQPAAPVEPAPAQQPAAAPVPDQTATPAPAAPRPAASAAAPQPATAPRVQVAPSASQSRAPVPAPVTAVGDDVTAAPAPPPAPSAEAVPTPVPAPAAGRRSVMVSMSDSSSSGSPALAMALVGVGLVLALGASALVLASRREGKAAAKARR